MTWVIQFWMKLNVRDILFCFLKLSLPKYFTRLWTYSSQSSRHISDRHIWFLKKKWFFKNDCSMEFLWTFRTGGRIWDDNREVSPSTQLPWALSTWGDPSKVSKSCQSCCWLMFCKSLIKYDSEPVVYIFCFLQRSYVRYKRKNWNKDPRHPA